MKILARLIALAVLSAASPAFAAATQEAPPAPASQAKPAKEMTEEEKAEAARNVRGTTTLDITKLKFDKRLCEPRDLPGDVWQMIYFREDPPGKQTKKYRRMRYQYFVFYPDMSYFRMISSKQFNEEELNSLVLKDKRVNAKYQNIMGKPMRSFTLDKEGEMYLMTKDLKRARYTCSLIEKEQGSFKPGDMVLAGYTTASKATFYEVYRRINQ